MKKDLYREEVRRRGFLTEMETGFAGQPRRLNRTEVMKLKERRRGLRLYVLEGWRKYSRNTVYYQKFVYLAGVDNGVYWAIRCPSTVSDIDEAITYTTPAIARNARAAGRKVLRQGDVFVVEKKVGPDNLDDLPASHSWNAETREILHPTHKALKIPFPFRVAVGKSINSKAD